MPSVNPNVMYEIGYAHALGKPTFLLAENPECVPFNVGVDRVIMISDPGSTAARSRLTDMLRSVRHQLDAAASTCAYETTFRQRSP